MTITYNAPPGTPSDIGPQAVLLKYEKQALIVARQKQYLHELAPQAKSIPRNMGKTIVQDLYVPILDDRNTFAEGLAADGTTVIAGNLYGSSKDVAAITAKLPLVNENSNRPNRVGLTRLQRTATITRLGMFLEWSDEAEAFDSDSQLISHFSTELVNAACKISEDVLMMHLLAGATTIRYAGTATSRATITGEGGVNAVSLVRYRDIQALSIMLDQAETPKSFKMYTGTNLTDTRTISSARPMFIGNELQPTVENMLDSNSQPAFIQVFKYAAGGAVLNGEIGTLYHFRVVVHPDMQHWSDGANLAVAATPNGYLWADLTQDKYRVFPMLVVGDDAFATVGFQTTQNGTKFQIIINKPGAGMATLDNPYGNKGFSSIQWWYATLIQQPERLGLILTVAPIL